MGEFAYKQICEGSFDFNKIYQELMPSVKNPYLEEKEIEWLINNYICKHYW